MARFQIFVSQCPGRHRLGIHLPRCRKKPSAEEAISYVGTINKQKDDTWTISMDTEEGTVRRIFGELPDSLDGEAVLLRGHEVKRGRTAQPGIYLVGIGPATLKTARPLT